MVGIKDELAREGVDLVAIGSGSPNQAKNFVEKFGFTGELYVDEPLHAFKAFGLGRGFWKTLGLSSISQGLKAKSQGFSQGRSAGDLWQQGGVFVLGPGNRILFEHRDMKAGLHAQPADVVEACQLPGTP